MKLNLTQVLAVGLTAAALAGSLRHAGAGAQGTAADPVSVFDGNEPMTNSVNPQQGIATEAKSAAPRMEIAFEPDAEPGTLIVELAPDISASLYQQLASGRTSSQLALPASLQALGQRYGLREVTPVFPVGSVTPAAIDRLTARYARRKPHATRPTADLTLWHVIRLAPHTDLAAALADFRRDPGVRTVETNRYARLSQNDPWAVPPCGWGLQKVNAPAAWSSSGSTGAGVRVAVVDTGADYNHTDLAANLLPGWDFYNNDAIAQDDHSHGTHVSGIIAAIANNNLGVAGVAPAAKIIPIKAFGAQGQGGSITVLSIALVSALAQNIDAINASWGGPGRSALIESILKTAESFGVVTIAAAGNWTQDASDFFPANIEYAVTVSATDSADVAAAYSNFGVKLDVAAPGGSLAGGCANDVLSTVLGTYSGAGVQTAPDNSKYAPLAGTSMAAPFVTGVAALLVAQHPNWTVEELKQAIRKGATDVSTPGFDTASGYGRVNALASTALASTPPTAALMKPYNGQVVEDNAALEGFALPPQTLSATYTVATGAGATPSVFTPALGPQPASVSDSALGTLNTLNLADGAQTIKVTTLASNLQTAEDRNLVTVNNVYITAPATGEMLTGSTYAIIGKVMGNLGFQSYTLDWSSGYNNTAGPFTFIATAISTQPAGSTLGSWNLAPVPDGNITLRLTAVFSQHTTTEYVNVIVDKKLMPGWPAAVNHVPSLKSPKFANLDGVGAKELIYGGSVYDANGAVHAGWTNTPGLGRTNPAIANIDTSTGDLEVVVAEFESHYYNSIYPNGGAPVIRAYKHDKQLIWSFPIDNVNSSFDNGTPSAISIGDVLGSGSPEVVFSVHFFYGNPTLDTTVFVLDAATGAQLVKFSVTGRENSSIAIADIEKGGKKELVLSTMLPANAGGQVHVVHGNGSAVPGWPVTVTSAFDNYGLMDPVVGDVDRDCKYEILVGYRLFRANGTLMPGWASNSSPWNRHTGAFAQVDSDSAWEVIGGGINYVVSWVMEPDGVLKHMLSTTIENVFYFNFFGFLQSNESNAIVADLDANGKPDIIKASEYGFNQPWAGMPLHVWNSSSGAAMTTYERHVPTSTTLYPASLPIASSAGVGDLNGDGKVDMALAAGGKIYVWTFGTNYSAYAQANAWPMFQHDLANTGATGLPWTCPILDDET